LIKINPVADSSPPAVKKQKVKDLWTKEETKRFLDLVEEKGLGSIYITEIFTGMRRGENLGLKWSDIDFDDGTIHVQRSLTRTKSKGLILKDVKTENSNRIVVISDYVVQALQKQLATQETYKKMLGSSYKDNGLVNCTEDGMPIDPRNLLRQFYRLMDEAKVPKITFHDLRHLHATTLMALGENPKVVADRLGHSKVQFTLDIYSHVYKEIQRNTANRFEDNMLKNQK
jgi:integrase